MLTKVIIVGARADGHAKVVLKIIQALPNFEFVGFVDDTIEMKSTKIDGYSVLGQFLNKTDYKKTYKTIKKCKTLSLNNI